ncbi:hypothetical protein OCS_01034 [Ophiocordyceps sinensis CO18]|uniref:Uncharacterized protein n=1 Tax=Ophiocordyceps sinensis (strain Co18 / CGMCC 3.14243) TaxID=911162 RepID=T5ACQ5_OPHSC|nr:hypothetical protein OCS_01034 [Ophiocordyceps sinensis CO18]
MHSPQRTARVANSPVRDMNFAKGSADKAEQDIINAEQDIINALSAISALDPDDGESDESLAHDSASVLGLAMKRWLARDPDTMDSRIYYRLQQNYIEDDVSLEALWYDEDFATVEALQDACAQLPVDVFLAHLEKGQMSICEPKMYCPGDKYGGYDPVEPTYKVMELFDLLGRIVTEDLLLPYESSLLRDCFLDEEVDEEECGDLEDIAVIIVPRASVASFLNPNDLV